VDWGGTRVLATATRVEGVPPFLAGTGKGWLTAEYSMLPGSTSPRKSRGRGGKVDGRSTEIQRLIGRSLRAAVDLSRLSENTIYVDCDVIEADGGTRVASVTAGYVAVVLATRALAAQGSLTENPVRHRLAAVSVGIAGGKALLDLDADEDQVADVDMNIVMLDTRKYIEVQGTAEGAPFDDDEMLKLLALAKRGIRRIDRIQKDALAGSV